MSLTSFEMPKFEMPKFDLPLAELPESYREWAKGGVAQLKDNYEKAKAAADNATGLVAGSCKFGAEGALSYGAKVMDSARANSDAAVDLIGNLACATSYAEVFELSTAYLRRQYQAATEQGRELAALAQKVATDTFEPLKEGLGGAFPKVG